MGICKSLNGGGNVATITANLEIRTGRAGGMGQMGVGWVGRGVRWTVGEGDYGLSLLGTFS